MAERGRPRKIGSPKEMKEKADAYFAERERDGRPITLTGVMLACGVYGKATWHDYGKRKEFSETVKEITAKVAASYEERLHGNSPTGAIFALKNMGWSDRQEVAMDAVHKVESITYTVIDPKADDA